MAVEGDVLLLVLLDVEIQSLLHCCCVCKSWRELIRSGWFRKAWCERHWREQSSVLLCFVDSERRFGVRRWLPPSSSASSSQGTISPYLEFQIGVEHSKFDVVASSNGLLCVCLDDFSCRYAVGNPVTREWVHLPQLPDKDYASFAEYSLRAYAGGEFKLQVVNHDPIIDHVIVFTSRSRSWRKVSKAQVSVPEIKEHDVDEGWISIKYPIQLKKGDSIPRVARWSCNGHTYLAGCFQEYGGYSMEHLVWKACRLEMERQAPVSSAGGDRVSWLLWDTGVNEKQVVREEVADRDLWDFTRVIYHGEGKLCAAAVDMSMAPMPPSVYDVSSNVWYHLGELAPRGFTYCTRAVVYHPSMIKPDPGGDVPGHGTRSGKRAIHELSGGDRLIKQRKISVAGGA